VRSDSPLSECGFAKQTNGYADYRESVQQSSTYTEQTNEAKCTGLRFNERGRWPTLHVSRPTTAAISQAHCTILSRDLEELVEIALKLPCGVEPAVGGAAMPGCRIQGLTALILLGHTQHNCTWGMTLASAAIGSSKGPGRYTGLVVLLRSNC